MNQKLNRIAELLKELENWLCLISSLEEEMQRPGMNITNNEGLDELIAILEAALAAAEQEVRRCELLFEESAPGDYTSWLAALPDQFEFLWKARKAS